MSLDNNNQDSAEQAPAQNGTRKAAKVLLIIDAVLFGLFLLVGTIFSLFFGVMGQTRQAADFRATFSVLFLF